MNRIAFGWAQLTERTPKFVKWLRTTAAAVFAAATGLQMIYPQYISNDLLLEIGKASSAIVLLAPYFGVKPEEPAQNN